MAALAAAALGGSIISAGATIGSSLGTASMQEKNSAQLQQNDQKFQTQIINRGENAFTEAGLPKFLYWGGGNLNTSLPNTQAHLGGTAFAQYYGVNSNLPYYSNNPIPQYMGTAKPRPTTSPTAEGNRNLQTLSKSPNRPGLGFVPASTNPTNPSSAAPGPSMRMPDGKVTEIGSPAYVKSLQLIYNSRETQTQPQVTNVGTSMRRDDFATADKFTSMYHPTADKYTSMVAPTRDAYVTAGQSAFKQQFKG